MRAACCYKTAGEGGTVEGAMINCRRCICLVHSIFFSFQDCLKFIALSRNDLFRNGNHVGNGKCRFTSLCEARKRVTEEVVLRRTGLPVMIWNYFFIVSVSVLASTALLLTFQLHISNNCGSQPPLACDPNVIKEGKSGWEALYQQSDKVIVAVVPQRNNRLAAALLNIIANVPLEWKIQIFHR